MTSPAWLLLAFLLLAGAFALLADMLLRRQKQARAYLQGVRYVLSDDPDAAIEALSDAARLGSPAAVETYLALGALFRRTGDLARAIRLHRNMLMRPGLDPARRREIEMELAHDYRRGGMLEEALAAYRSLAETGDSGAKEGLRDVLIDLDRFAEAAEVQRQISPEGEDPFLSHLLAAQARSELKVDKVEALRAARAAIAAAPRSPDGLLALAEAQASSGLAEEARSAVAAALDEDPSAALLAWPALAILGDPARSLELVEGRLARGPGDAFLHYLRGRLLHELGRSHEAIASLRRALDLDATGEIALAMRDLLQQTPAPEDLAARHHLMVAVLLRQVRPFRCCRCGAEAPTRGWRCRCCGAFESHVPAPGTPPDPAG